MNLLTKINTIAPGQQQFGFSLEPASLCRHVSSMYTGNLNEGHFSFLLDLQLSRLTSLTAVHGQFLLTCHFKNNLICFHNLPPPENDVQNVRSCVNLTASRKKYSKSSASLSAFFFFFKTQPKGGNFKVNTTGIWQCSGRTYTGMKLFYHDKSNPSHIQKAMCHHCSVLYDRVKAVCQLKF